MRKIEKTLILLLFICYGALANAKTETDDITTYSGNDDFVYAVAQQSWFALNNNNEYERWGIVENVSDLQNATTYKGKYVRMGQVIYYYKNGWVETDIAVNELSLPANGVYILDANGNFTNADNWNVTNNYISVGIALVSDNVKLVVAPNYKIGLQHLTYAGVVDGVTRANSFTAASNDFAGKSNTEALVSHCGANAPQAFYCYSYLFKNGIRGYEPAFGELLKIFNDQQNKEEFNKGMKLISDWWVGCEEKLADTWFASSTERGTRCFWRISKDGLHEGESAFDYTNDSYKNYVAIPFGELPEYAFDYPYDSEPMDSQPIESISTQSMDMPLGWTTKINIAITPEDADLSKLIWTSSDNNVLIVSSDGKIETVGVGTATVSILTMDGRKVFKDYVINVIKKGSKYDLNNDGNINVGDVSTLYNVILGTE